MVKLTMSLIFLNVGKNILFVNILKSFLKNNLIMLNFLLLIYLKLTRILLSLILERLKLLLITSILPGMLVMLLMILELLYKKIYLKMKENTLNILENHFYLDNVIKKLTNKKTNFHTLLLTILKIYVLHTEKKDLYLILFTLLILLKQNSDSLLNGLRNF